MRTRSLIPAALLLYGCSLHHRPIGPAPARGPARDSLFQLDASRGDSVAARGPVDGVFTLLSDDVVYLRAGVPAVYRRSGVRVLLAADAAAIPPGTSWQPLGGGVSDDLHSGYTFGITARPSPDHGAIRLERYIAYWQRTGALPWRIAAYAEIGAPVARAPAPAGLDTSPPVRPATSKPTVRDAAREEMRAADSLFADLAYRMGTGYAFSNTVAPDGVVFGSPALVVGPDAVRRFYAERGETSLAWHPVYASIAASRDLGFTVGEYISTVLGPSGAAVQRFGKYLTVWKRQSDGSWKFLVDGGNSTPAGPRK